MKKISALAAIVFTALNCLGANYSYLWKWTGAGSTLDWSNPDNWSCTPAGADHSYPQSVEDYVNFDQDLDAGPVVTSRLDVAVTLYGLTIKGSTPVRITATGPGSIAFDLAPDAQRESNLDGLTVAKDSTLFLDAPVYQNLRFDRWGDGTIVWGHSWSNGVPGNVDCGSYIGGGGTNIFAEGFQLLLGRGTLHLGFNNSPDGLTAELFQCDRSNVKATGLTFGSSRNAVNCIWHQNGDDSVTEIGGVGLVLGGDLNTDAWSTSTYHLVRGTLSSPTGPLSIGKNRPGRYVQDGGEATFNKIESGSHARSYGEFILNDGRFKVNGSIDHGTAGRLEFYINGGTFAGKANNYINARLHFSGSPNIEVEHVNNKDLKLMYTPVIAPGTTLHKTGTGTFAIAADFPATAAIVVEEGTFMVTTDTTIHRAGVYGAPNDYTPWPITIKNGAKFSLGTIRNQVYQTLDLTIEDGGIFSIGGSRSIAFAHSASTGGVALARGKYTSSNVSGPIRNEGTNNGLGCLAVVYTWIGGGDGVSWSDANNWEDGAVPPNSANSYADMSRATNVTFSSNITIGGMLYAPNGANKELVIYSESSWCKLDASSFSPSCVIRPDATLIFDCEMRRGATCALLGGGTYVFKRYVLGANAGPTTAPLDPIHCIDGTLIYRDVTQFIKYNNDASKDTCLSFWSGGDGTDATVVFEGQDTDIAFNRFVWARGGYSAFNRLIQRNGAKVTINNLYINPHRNDNQTPLYYYLQDGDLVCVQGIYLNKSLTSGNTSSSIGNWKRYGGGSFQMNGGTLTTPLMTSESYSNWYWLDGGDVYLGAGGIVRTDDSENREPHKNYGGYNTTPSLQLGGATLHATDDFTVTLDTAFSGRGGGATIDTAGHDIVFDECCSVSGSASWRKTGEGTVTFNGTNSFTGLLTVDEGSVVIGGSAVVTDVPARLDLASASSLSLPAGANWSVGALTVGGVPVAAGSSQSFGAGTVTVATAPSASAGHWIGPASGGSWLASANWVDGGVPNGETAAAVLDGASLQDGANISFDGVVALGSLSVDVPGTITLSASNDAYLLLTNATVTVSPQTTLVLDSTVVVGKAPTNGTAYVVTPLVVTGGGKVVFAGDLVNQDRSYNLNSAHVMSVPSSTTLEFRGLLWGIMLRSDSISRHGTTPAFIAAPGAKMNFAASPLSSGQLVVEQTGGNISFTNSVKFTSSGGQIYTHTMKSGELLVSCGTTLQQGWSTASLRLEGGTVRTSGVGTPFASDLPVTLAGDITFAQNEPGDISVFASPIHGAGGITQTGPGRVSFQGTVPGVPLWKATGGTLEIDCATPATNIFVTAGTLAIGGNADIPAAVDLNMTHSSSLEIGFDGEFTVRTLRINGHPRSAGLYDDGTRYDTSLAPYITGPGVLRVLEGVGPGLRIFLK